MRAFFVLHETPLKKAKHQAYKTPQKILFPLIINIRIPSKDDLSKPLISALVVTTYQNKYTAYRRTNFVWWYETPPENQARDEFQFSEI